MIQSLIENAEEEASRAVSASSVTQEPLSGTENRSRRKGSAGEAFVAVNWGESKSGSTGGEIGPSRWGKKSESRNKRPRPTCGVRGFVEVE